ncbi:MAG: hypothetical protein M3T49_01045 [Candidatus Eremiobacteraeota bacterium]|nr:hypothetical protein [Candidatus Eremiobacteraeota bacterium]
MFLRGAAAGVLLLAAFGRTPGARAATDALHVGDRISQTAVAGYLFFAPAPGDWVRYSVTIDGKPALIKTVGFGRERFGAKDLLYVETRLQTPPVTGLPVPSSNQLSADAVEKTFIDADNFGLIDAVYDAVATLEKVGDSVFYLAAPKRFTLLPGFPLADTRSGQLTAVQPEPLRVGNKTVQTVHLSVAFAGDAVTGGPTVEPFGLQSWQSPDVPLGTALMEATLAGHEYRIALMDFGRGAYSSAIPADRSDLHNPSSPP